MSNREIQSFPYTMGNQGILLKSSTDEIPITAYAYLKNMFTDRENTLTVRRGWARLGSTPSTPNVPNGYLKTASGSFRYCRSGVHWCRASIGGAYNSISAALSGNVHFTVAENVLNDTPYIFGADGTAFLKDYGTGNATAVGMNTPSKAVTAQQATVSGVDKIEVDYFESGIANWPTTLLAGTGTATNSSITDGYSGKGMRITLSDAESMGRSKKTMSLDFGDDDNLSIEFYARWPTEADSLNTSKIVISFSIGDTTFNTRFEKSLVSHPAQESVNTTTYPTLTIEEAQAAWMAELNNRIASSNNAGFINQLAMASAQGASPDTLDALAQTLGLDPFSVGWNQYLGGVSLSAQQQATQLSPVDIPLGVGVWNQIRVAKTDFQRIGITTTTDASLDWADIKAVGIQILSAADAGCSFDIDEISYRSAGQLSGPNISYTFTYYDSVTGTESDYADVYQIPVALNKDQVLITFTDTPPSNATHRKLYRLGGTIEQFQLVDTILIGTTTYTDDNKDSSLTSVLLTDNQTLEITPKGVAGYDNRLFVWGGTGEPPNRLRFSKRNLVETFPRDYYIPVGTGSETIVRCIDFDGELFIFTLNTVYRLIGTDINSYRAISTRSVQGLTIKKGVAKSNQSIYMAASDGIYEFPSGKRISEAINPIWRGQTVNGIPPLITGSTIGYFNQKIYVSYRNNNNAPESRDSGILVYDMGYERWHFYDYGTTDFFYEPADYDIGKEAILLGGVIAAETSGGNPVETGYYIHQLETGSKDYKLNSVTGIDFKMITKDLDMGIPDQEKQFIDLVIDADTAGSDVNVYYATDMGISTNPDNNMIFLGTINTGTGGRIQNILPFPDSVGESIYGNRLQIKISGTTNPSTATYDNNVKIHKIIPRFLIEPPKHSTFVTDWSDEGSPDEKIFRELHIEYNSYGYTPVIHLEVDGAEVYSFNGTPSTYRKKFYYALPTTSDITGTKSRIRIELT